MIRSFAYCVGVRRCIADDAVGRIVIPAYGYFLYLDQFFLESGINGMREPLGGCFYFPRFIAQQLIDYSVFAGRCNRQLIPSGFIGRGGIVSILDKNVDKR